MEAREKTPAVWRFSRVRAWIYWRNRIGKIDYSGSQLFWEYGPDMLIAGI
jgi:hypothetical protein